MYSSLCIIMASCVKVQKCFCGGKRICPYGWYAYLLQSYDFVFSKGSGCWFNCKRNTYKFMQSVIVVTGHQWCEKTFHNNNNKRHFQLGCESFKIWISIKVKWKIKLQSLYIDSLIMQCPLEQGYSIKYYEQQKFLWLVREGQVYIYF